MGTDIERIARDLGVAFRTDRSTMRFFGSGIEGLGRAVSCPVPQSVPDSKVAELCTRLAQQLQLQLLNECPDTSALVNLRGYLHSADYYRWEICPTGLDRPVQHISFRSWPNGQREVTVHVWE